MKRKTKLPKVKRRRQRPSWLAVLDVIHLVRTDIESLHIRLDELTRMADDTHAALTAIAYWIAQRQEGPPGRFRIVDDSSTAANGRRQ